VNAPTKSPSKVDGAEAHHFVGFNSETQNEGEKNHMWKIDINIGIGHFFF